MQNKDIWQRIITDNLPIKDFLSLAQAAKFFQLFQANDAVWKSLFERDFGFLPADCSDIKFKYMVAHHFKLGKEAMVLNKSRFFHKKVVSLLQNYQQLEPWMKYYLGTIYAYSWHGNCSFVEKGIELLKENVDYYPALKELINFIYGDYPSYPAYKKNALKNYVKGKVEPYKYQKDGGVLRDTGSLYAKGILYPKDLNMAELFFRRAIALNFYEAYCDLGLCLLELDRKDEAKNAYITGEEYGIVQASHLLGDFYSKEGEQENALKSYQKALEKGDHEAGFKVGVIYAKEKNGLVQSWFDELYKKGSSKAAFFLGAMHQQQGKISNAIEWFTKGVQKGNDDSAKFLGDLYLQHGLLNPNKALDYYIMAYQLGNKKILEKIAFVYLNYFEQLDSNKVQECIYWLANCRELCKDLLSLIRVQPLSLQCSLAVNLTLVIKHVKESSIDKATELYRNTWEANPEFVDRIKKAAFEIESLTDDQARRLNSVFEHLEHTLETTLVSSPGVK